MTAYATVYDPDAPSEKPVPLPSAPRVAVGTSGLSLQPPLSRRGTGPGLILFQPAPEALKPLPKGKPKPIDPEPVQKWAEEGYAVVAVGSGVDVGSALVGSVQALRECAEVDVKDKYAVLVYDPAVLPALRASLPDRPELVCLISHGASAPGLPVPTLCHVPTAPKDHPDPRRGEASEPNGHGHGAALLKNHFYPPTSPHFVLPTAGSDFHPPSASLVHTRSLVFLRKHLGGPVFDLEEIWDEHTFFEFVDRSVAKTMGTMVAEPYVNHIPTMTGGIGREALSAFYRDHFIFSNPPNAALSVVSRTVGPDRVVDEFVYSCDHTTTIDWLLPGVPPSGRRLEIPMMAVVNVRGDRLYHEHIWWDGATAMQQAGVLPQYVPHGLDGTSKLRLPTDGYASARMLLDETDGTANHMFGKEWGMQPA